MSDFNQLSKRNELFSVNNLIEENEQKDLAKITVYHEIIDKCRRRIEYSSSKNFTSCVFSVPPIIYGYPRVDLTKATEKLGKWLRKRGFQYTHYYDRYSHSVNFSISWELARKVRKFEQLNTEAQSQSQFQYQSQYQQGNSKEENKSNYKSIQLNTLAQLQKQADKIRRKQR